MHFPVWIRMKNVMVSENTKYLPVTLILGMLKILIDMEVEMMLLGKPAGKALGASSFWAGKVT